MLIIFFFNAFLGVLWIILLQSNSMADYIIGFAIAFGVLSFFEPQYGRRGYYAVVFLATILWQVIVSSLQLAWVLIQPRLEITPGIIAIPLDVTNDYEIATLASSITLTPGTLSVDIGRDVQSGQRVLFVHTLFTDEPDKLRDQIKNGFERYILEISRGGSRKEEASDGE